MSVILYLSTYTTTTITWNENRGVYKFSPNKAKLEMIQADDNINQDMLWYAKLRILC